MEKPGGPDRRAIKCFCCGGVLPEADFNVSTDLAYCRKCGRSFSFAEALRRDGAPFDLFTPPAYIAVFEEWGGMVMRYRKISPACWLMIPFIVGWVGFSVYALADSIAKTGLSFDTMGISPFVLVAAGLIPAGLYLLFGKIEIRGRDGVVEIFTGVGRVGRHCRFEREAIQTVGFETVRNDGHDWEYIAITMRNGRRHTFGQSIPEPQRRFICDYLRRLANLY